MRRIWLATSLLVVSTHCVPSEALPRACRQVSGFESSALGQDFLARIRRDQRLKGLDLNIDRVLDCGEYYSIGLVDADMRLAGGALVSLALLKKRSGEIELLPGE